jgi:hypothetical protein
MVRKRRARPRQKIVRQHGSTNTEPGANRGPQTGSPAGVVVATWVERGSKRYLWTESDVINAVVYVEYDQGGPL